MSKFHDDPKDDFDFPDIPGSNPSPDSTDTSIGGY